MSIVEGGWYRNYNGLQWEKRFGERGKGGKDFDKYPVLYRIPWIASYLGYDNMQGTGGEQECVIG